VLGQTTGPVFRGIDQWGHISERGLTPGSIVPWLRKLFHAAGVPDVDTYSSHSLRRGFANWAKSSGWDLKELMGYVGWSDFNSALRYLELSEEDLSQRFESAMDDTPPSKRAKLNPRRTSAESSPPTSNVVTLRRRPSE
jgi:integrase